MSEFPNLDMDLGFGADPQPVPQDNKEPATGSVTLSNEQFQQLIAQIGQQRQEQDYTTAITGEAPVGPPPVDLSSLPDPRSDIEGFRSGLGNMLTQARDELIQHTHQVAVQEQERTSTLDTAWSLMQERYPDIAEHSEIVQMAASREMDALRARGMDPMMVLSQNMEQAIDTIAQRAGATINRIKGLQEGDGDGSLDRTDMLGGGSPAPRRPGRSGRDPAPTSFVDDLKKLQRELKIY